MNNLNVQSGCSLLFESKNSLLKTVWVSLLQREALTKISKSFSAFLICDCVQSNTFG